MATPTRDSIATAMRDIDICMMTTRSPNGGMTSRPMSNNAEVEWTGDNWFFSRPDTRKMREIEAEPEVTLDFEGEGLWITVRGTARVHTDEALMREHWTPDIEKWFGGELDADKLRLIQVEAREAEAYGREEGIVAMG
ncbi:pyridoxamine 5'-phosphate oxidase family protein [Wenxinia saemankumensis]|uniref:General stress protein 26 n=1 Tax=Wenxinia saemankumensis TaxID=1447782 RepID=A0A1M6C931_9RHOB|nr:pyridoxamine 5'-phosphate oxidase family protein [Wenxinia saemankumensis]SHI57311.1 General stress protein 26 [Wenxinia saemankumensis]